MKKIKIILISCLLCFMGIKLNDVKAEETFSENDYIKAVSSFIYTFDDKDDVSVSFDRYLKDVNNKESFVLLSIGEDGYAVIAKDSDMILEIRYGAKAEIVGDNLYYVSAGEFLSEQEYSSETRKRSDTFADARQRLNDINNEKGIKFVYDETLTRGKVIEDKPSHINGGTEIGIPSSRMEMFAEKSGPWHNSDGNCGSIAAANMITYLDKYVNRNFIKQPYDISSYSHAKWIVNLFTSEIEILGLGSTPASVASGTQRACYKVNNKSTVVGFTTSSEAIMKSKIASGYPVVLELPGSRNDVYVKAHMVCGYRYVDYNGYLWFQASDNWGYLAWINRNWVGKGVYVTI